MSAVARRYARAAIDAALDKGGQKAIDALLEGVSAFRDAWSASDEMRQVLSNPQLGPERDAALQSLAGKLGLSELALSTVRLLLSNERLDLIDEVTTELE